MPDISQTFSAATALQGILLGMILGSIGQGVRVVIGLKKANDSAQQSGSSLKDVFDASRLVISLAIGAIAGALASLPLLSQLASLSYQTLLTLIAAGYAGADFIEGFMSKALPNVPAPKDPAPDEVKQPIVANGADFKGFQSPLLFNKPLQLIAAPSNASNSWEIGSVTVVQDDDNRVHWQSRGEIDADGSNGQNGKAFAYRADNKGLDDYANAGWPDKSWRDVLVTDPKTDLPADDGSGNWYSSTAYAWPNSSLDKRYVDATTVPYVVVNPIVRKRARGVVMGSKARITYMGKSVQAVVADVSGPDDVGEMSMAAADLLGIPSNPRGGGVGNGVQFEFWPGTAAVVNGVTYLLEQA